MLRIIAGFKVALWGPPAGWAKGERLGETDETGETDEDWERLMRLGRLVKTERD